MKKIIAVILATLMIIPLGIVFTSAAETNIAAGKGYTLTGVYTENDTVQYPDTDNKELTDGTSGTLADIGYASAIWTGLNITGENADEDAKTNIITVDLGSVEQKLTKFVLYTESCEGGISKPKFVKVSVSDNNSAFTPVGDAVETVAINKDDAEKPTYGIYAYTVSLTTSVSGRYIQFLVEHGSNWGFVSEVEVYQDPDAAVGNVKVEETIAVDGELEDTGWVKATWNHVDSTNGKFQTVYTTTPTFAYDWAVRTDDTNLYVAVKINQKANFDELSQTGATNFRLWTDSDMSDVKFSGVYDFTYNETSCEDTRKTKSSDSVSALTTGDKYTYYEVSIKLADLSYDAAKDFGIYLTVSDINLSEALDKISDNNYDALHCATFEKAGEPWVTTADYIKLDFDSLALGEFTEETSAEESSEIVPDYTDITGDLVENPSYLLEVSAPDTYKAGETINVTITLKNVTDEVGLDLIHFLLHYDATRVEPVIVNNAAKGNVEMNSFLTTSPDSEIWESISKLEADKSQYDLSFLTTMPDLSAKDDGSIVVVVPFKVKATATGSIAFQVPHKSSDALGQNIDLTLNGNAGLAVAELATADESSATASDTSTPKTGDAGTIAIALVAVLALAGASTIAIKKRSR